MTSDAAFSTPELTTLGREFKSRVKQHFEIHLSYKDTIWNFEDSICNYLWNFGEFIWKTLKSHQIATRDWVKPSF